jgi:hypothetical protein
MILNGKVDFTYILFYYKIQAPTTERASMRAHINEIRQAIHGVIQPIETPWLTFYASPEADQDEKIQALTDKVWQLISDNPACSPFWGRQAHIRLQDLCVSTWWRRVVTRAIIGHIIRKDIQNGTITTSPGYMMDGWRNYMVRLG